MSLLSWNLTPARVQIVMDTLVFSRDGTPMFFASKFFHLAHARLVICDLGAAAVGFELQRRACSCRLLGGIDDFAERFPGWCAEIHQAHLADYGGTLDPRLYEDVSVIAAFGWSEERNRIVGYGVASPRGYALEPMADVDWHLPPPATDPADPYVQEVRSEHARELRQAKFPEAFIPIAKLQRHAAMLERGYGIGGELLLCELTRDRLSVRRLWTFPDHAATAAAVRCGVPAAPEDGHADA